MTKKLCSDDACYVTLAPFIGKEILVRESGEKFTGVLSVWTANNGNEGWLVGDMDKQPWILFSGDCIERIEIMPLINSVTVRIRP